MDRALARRILERRKRERLAAQPKPRPPERVDVEMMRWKRFLGMR